MIVFEGTEPEQNIEKQNKITTLQFLRLDFSGNNFNEMGKGNGL